MTSRTAGGARPTTSPTHPRRGAHRAAERHSNHPPAVARAGPRRAPPHGPPDLSLRPAPATAATPASPAHRPNPLRRHGLPPPAPSLPSHSDNSSTSTRSSPLPASLRAPRYSTRLIPLTPHARSGHWHAARARRPRRVACPAPRVPDIGHRRPHQPVHVAPAAPHPARHDLAAHPRDRHDNTEQRHGVERIARIPKDRSGPEQTRKPARTARPSPPLTPPTLRTIASPPRTSSDSTAPEIPTRQRHQSATPRARPVRRARPEGARASCARAPASVRHLSGPAERGRRRRRKATSRASWNSTCSRSISLPS